MENDGDGIQASVPCELSGQKVHSPCQLRCTHNTHCDEVANEDVLFCIFLSDTATYDSPTSDDTEGTLSLWVTLCTVSLHVSLSLSFSRSLSSTSLARCPLSFYFSTLMLYVISPTTKQATDRSHSASAMALSKSKCPTTNNEFESRLKQHMRTVYTPQHDSHCEENIRPRHTSDFHSSNWAGIVSSKLLPTFPHQIG